MIKQLLTKSTLLVGLAILGLVLATASTSAAEELVINGSTTVLPIAQKAAEVYMKEHPDVSISVSGTGSGDGIKALIDGTTDIADSSRFIKDSEVEQATENGAFPVPHRIALDSIVPVVHPSNPVKDLTMKQLKGIYMGQITNWKEVGGEDKEIVVVSRDTSSGTYEVWHKLALEKERVTPKASLLASNGAIVTAVANNPYSIGYIGLGYVNSEVKAVTVGGIVPSANTTRSGKYPIARDLYMFTDGWPKGVVLDFINFLVSPAGQKVVEEVKYVPFYDMR
jgi:phosphate transport system substrate-binding protein